MKFAALCFGALCFFVQSLAAQLLTDPAAILAKSQAAYAGCATCKVEGQHRSDFKTERPYTVTKDMRLFFARPGPLIRLDWTEIETGGGSKTNSVFTRDGKAYFFWGSLDRFVRLENLDMALAGATGISSGLAHFLPQMLLGRSGSLDVKAPVLRPEETLNGRPCYVVAGRARFGNGPFEAAIDKETFAVTRVKDTVHVTAHNSQAVVDRLIKTEPKLAAVMAARPPTPDFDVDSVTDYQTTFGAPVTAQDCDYPVPAGMKLSAAP